jgi:hypothetical protein
VIQAEITGRNRTRRWERLEQRILPTSPEHVIQVIYLNTDGTEASERYPINGLFRGPAQYKLETPLPSLLFRGDQTQ